MVYFCSCEECDYLAGVCKNLFRYDEEYGWVLQWIELTQEKGYTQIHRYCIPIDFCPMCGKKLLNKNIADRE